MSDKRVALVLPNLTLGGAERQAVALALALPRLGWEPVVMAAEMHGPLIETIREAGLPLHDLGAELWRKKWTPGFWLNLHRTIRRIASITDEHQAPIVQSFLFWQNQLAVPAFSRSKSARAVITGRRNLGGFKDVRRHYQLLENCANRLTTAVVCNANVVREDVLNREVITEQKVRVIHNGIDLNGFNQNASAPLDFPPGGPVIGTVGNLKSQKRHDLFLRVVAALRERRPGVRGVIVGRDLGELSHLNSICEELGLIDAVTIVTSGEEAAPWYRAMDLMLLTSDFEGLPNVVLEAMAAGRAVVATDAGGTRELVVDGVTGYVVPTGDVNALEARAIDLLDNEGRRAAMAAAGLARVREHFTVGAMARRYVELYEELLS